MEQREAAEKLKELQQEQCVLAGRSTSLVSLLHQQWESYRRHRCRQDLILLITILQEANLVKECISRLAHSQEAYESKLKQKHASPPIKASAERLKAVTLELRELNKKLKGIERDEAGAIERCASVIEFMDLDDMYQMISSRKEILAAEKKVLQQVLKKSDK